MRRRRCVLLVRHRPAPLRAQVQQAIDDRVALLSTVSLAAARTTSPASTSTPASHDRRRGAGDHDRPLQTPALIAAQRQLRPRSVAPTMMIAAGWRPQAQSSAPALLACPAWATVPHLPAVATAAPAESCSRWARGEWSSGAGRRQNKGLDPAGSAGPARERTPRRRHRRRVRGRLIAFCGGRTAIHRPQLQDGALEVALLAKLPL